MVAGSGKIVGEPLDAGLVRHRRARVRGARGRLGRILTTRAVHLVELLGQRVVRLHLLVGNRPCGRDAVVVVQLAEVLLAQAVERRAVELGGAPDEVVNLGLEGLPVPVVPRVGRDVPVLDEHVLREPVAGLARQPLAAFEQQHALARRSEMARERAASGAAADDDHVVVVHVRTPRAAWGR